MTVARPYTEPVARVAYVRPRLALVRSTLTDDRLDWDEVQRAVDDSFAELAAMVARRRAGVQSRSGENRSPAVLLYAYRVFEPAFPPDADPIVSGVAFKRTPRGILVRGDFCGEESGRVHFEHQDCRREVPEEGRAVLTAASAVAARLAREIDRLVDALDAAQPA